MKNKRINLKHCSKNKLTKSFLLKKIYGRAITRLRAFWTSPTLHLESSKNLEVCFTIDMRVGHRIVRIARWWNAFPKVIWVRKRSITRNSSNKSKEKNSNKFNKTHIRDKSVRQSKKAATMKIKNSNIMVANKANRHNHGHKANNNTHINSHKVNTQRINNIKTVTRMKAISKETKMIVGFIIITLTNKEKRTWTSLRRRVLMKSLKKLHKKLTSSNNSMMLLLHNKNNILTNHYQSNLHKKAHTRNKTWKSLTMRLTSSTSQIINIQTITSLPHQSSSQQALTLACTMKR